MAPFMKYMRKLSRGMLCSIKNNYITVLTMHHMSTIVKNYKYNFRVFDFMIGGIDEDPALADYLSTTIPYYQDDLTWCVARAGTSLAWMKIWEMFDGTTWLSVFIFLLIATSFIFGFQLSIVRRHKFIESILSAISIVLNQPLLITNYTLPFRFVMIGFIVFGMILNIMYQSLLITTLTRPSSEPQISKTEQLMNLKMRVFGGYEVGRNMDKNDSVSKK